MSRFLILSGDGDGIGLAQRLKAEGHLAKLWLKHDSESAKNIGSGIVDCACSFEFGQDVVADCTGFGALLDLFKASGVRIVSGSSFHDHLEEDRELSEEIMHEVGIETPESFKATSWEQAAKLVDKVSNLSEDGKVVIKPEGKLSGVIPSYVASDASDAQTMLESFERQSGDSKPVLTLQQFIKGVALSTEGWFDGSEWIGGLFNHTIERKQSLNDDLGPSIGCSGNVVWQCGSDDPVVKETLLKLTDLLREHEYVGPLDINCVVNKHGVFGLEFTPRFGYDAFPTFLVALFEHDFGSFLYRFPRGEARDSDILSGFGAGVRIRAGKEKGSDSVEIKGLDKDDLFWFYPFAVKQENEGILRTVGGDCPDIGVVNGYGDTIGEAFARVYDVISRLQIKDMQFRTDIAEVILKDYRELLGILEIGQSGWLGVDLDGTLAEYSDWSNEIGKPVPRMVQRVKRWIAEGKEVRVFTARGSIDGHGEAAKHRQLIKIHEWIKEHIGHPLEITHKKDPSMIRLYDDRVKEIEPNTGELVNS